MQPIRYDNIIVEEAGQISEIESFIPLLLQVSFSLKIEKWYKSDVKIKAYHINWWSQSIAPSCGEYSVEGILSLGPKLIFEVFPKLILDW